MPKFALHTPRTQQEVLDCLSRFRASVALLAGGTDIVQNIMAGKAQVENLVSLARVEGLKKVTYMDEDGLVLGAAARISQVAAFEEVRELYPVLAHACRRMATPQVRNQASVVGNLLSAYSAPDCAAPLLAHGASLVIAERGGRRQLKLDNYYNMDRLDAIEPMEMVEAVRVPAPLKRTGSCYLRLTPGSAGGPAALGLAGVISLDRGGNILDARLAVSGASPRPMRLKQAEEMLQDQAPEPRLLAQAGAACVRATSPADDLLASANFRRRMVQVLAGRVIARCVEMAREADDE